MAKETKETKKKEVKEFKVLKKSVGTAINWKGEKLILNNGLAQKVLKAMFNAGLKAVTN